MREIYPILWYFCERLLGWCSEVCCYAALRTGKFVNRLDFSTAPARSTALAWCW